MSNFDRCRRRSVPVLGFVLWGAAISWGVAEAQLTIECGCSTVAPPTYLCRGLCEEPPAPGIGLTFAQGASCTEAPSAVIGVACVPHPTEPTTRPGSWGWGPSPAPPAAGGATCIHVQQGALIWNFTPIPGAAAAEACSNGLDDDCDGLIDCNDPDCPPTVSTCLPINKDPGKIRFATAPGPGHDLLTVHGSLQPATLIDPYSEYVSVLLTNASGPIYAATLAPGNLQPKGRYAFKYHERAASRAKSGIARFEIIYRSHSSRYQFRIQTYADLSSATDPAMTFQIRIGDDSFVDSSTWVRTRTGWALTLPNE
jgi:hypothetical protein